MNFFQHQFSLQGTNAKEAKELIDNSGMEIISATEFQEAADKVKAVLEAS
jgi:succinyl-CoA synthetase beta subunit